MADIDITAEEVGAVEARLREAMLSSDIAELDALLAPELKFATHTGQMISKQDDLSAHRLGIVRISTLELTDTELCLLGRSAVVMVRVRLGGSIAGRAANGCFRFLRVWSRSEGGQLQLYAGQVSALDSL